MRSDAAKDDGKFVVDLPFEFLGAGQVGLVPRIEVTFLGRPHVADKNGETGNLLSHVSLQKKEKPLFGAQLFGLRGWGIGPAQKRWVGSISHNGVPGGSSCCICDTQSIPDDARLGIIGTR